MKIATKTGDEGMTGLLYGGRRIKSDILFNVIGDLDELSSFIGLAKFHLCDHNKKYYDLCEKIQKNLINLMGEISSSGSVIEYINNFGSITEADLEIIDKEVEFLQNLPELKMNDWVLYGKTLQGAYFDVASRVCRRAERSLVGYIEKLKHTSDTLMRPLLRSYINRLSDLLFLIARYCDFFYRK